MDRHQQLADAMAHRLAMQMSLSSLPVVEEWMDDRLGRWLESIPMPIEMPSDARADIIVTLAADARRLTWSACGTPAVVIPRLSRYLDQSGARPADLAPINAIGEAFEPAAVGSWIRVSPGHVDTGWQFEHPFELTALRPHLGGHAAPWLSWLEDHGVNQVWAVRGQLDGAAVDVCARATPIQVLSAVRELVGIDSKVLEALVAGTSVLELVVTGAGNSIEVGAVIPGRGLAVVANSLGVGVDAAVATVRAGLRASSGSEVIATATAGGWRLEERLCHGRGDRATQAG